MIEIHPPPQPGGGLQDRHVRGRIKVGLHEFHRIVIEPERGQFLKSGPGSIITEAHGRRRALQDGLRYPGQLPGAPTVERERVRAGYLDQQPTGICPSAGPRLRRPVEVGRRPRRRRESRCRIQELLLSVVDAPLAKHHPPQAPARLVCGRRIRISLSRTPQPLLGAGQVAVELGERRQRHHGPGRPCRLRLLVNQTAPDHQRFPVTVIQRQGAAEPVEGTRPVLAGDAGRLLERVRCSSCS